MHEYSRIARILNERNIVSERNVKNKMNGMIGSSEEENISVTDSPISSYLDGTDIVVAPIVGDKTP